MVTAHSHLQVEPGHFVQRQGARLVLEGKPFYFNGFCNYYMLTRAADKRGSGRKEVRDSIDLLLQHRWSLWAVLGTCDIDIIVRTLRAPCVPSQK
jgi:hypothetical protein